MRGVYLGLFRELKILDIVDHWIVGHNDGNIMNTKNKNVITTKVWYSCGKIYQKEREYVWMCMFFVINCFFVGRSLMKI